MASTAVVTALSKVPPWFAPPESSLVAVEPGDFGFSAGLPNGPVLRNVLQGREAWSVALDFLFEELALTPQTAEEQRNRKQRGLVPPQSTDVPELVVDRVARNHTCSASAAISSDVAQCWSLQQVCRREEEVQSIQCQAEEDQRGAAELRRQAEEERREAAELRREAEEDRQAARMLRGQAEEMRRQAERVAVAAQASNDVGGSAVRCDTGQDQGPLFSNAKELLKHTKAGKAEPHNMSFHAAMQEQEAKATAMNPVHAVDPFLKQDGVLLNAKTLLATEAPGAAMNGFSSAKSLLATEAPGAAMNGFSSAKSLLATKAPGATMNELETSSIFQKAKNLASGVAMQAVPAVKVNETLDLQPNLSEDPLLFGPEARAPFKPPRLGSASLGGNTGVLRNAPLVALAASDAETASSFVDNSLCLGPEARAPFKPPRPLERSMPVNVGVMADTVDFKGAAGGDDSLLGPCARKQFKRPRVSANAVGSDVGC